MSKKENDHRRQFLKKILGVGALAIGLPRIGSAMPFKSSGKILPLPHSQEADFKSEDGKKFTVLFQGDSITDGNRSRNMDWNHVMGHGYAYLISSRLWYTHPSRGFHFFNRGIGGNKVSDLAARWQQDTVEIKPDLLSILVGVNDLNSLYDKNSSHAVSAAEFEEGYRVLLKETKEKLPGTRIVVCEPFLLPVGKVKESWEAWSSEMTIRQAVVKKLASEAGALYVELQEDFNKACEKAPADYWIWDGIHPMPAGHELIARKWLHVVRKEKHFYR